MSIQVVCPNGHALKVKDDLAGKQGLCPVCKATVRVPKPRAAEFSEDSILDLLGKDSPAPTPRPALAQQGAVQAGAAAAEKPGGPAMPMKSCSKCTRQIALGIHICPYCHTYIAKLGDF